MNHKYLSVLNWIAAQEKEMLSLLKAWSDINSGSTNLDGLAKMLEVVRNEFLQTGGARQILPLSPRQSIDAAGNLKECPTGNALIVSKNPLADIQICLGGHIDTVFPSTSLFQTAQIIAPNILHGPGVLDMKGGLVIMIKALEALEKSPFSGKIGWQAFITPDEEVGSLSSVNLIKACAQNKAMGLVFEPSYPDGSFVSSRKGTTDLAIIVRGRAAHSGRDFYEGRSAVVSLARLIAEAEHLNDKEKGITLNFGKISGGEAVNVVPALAMAELNVRANELVDLKRVIEDLKEMGRKVQENQGTSIVFHVQENYPPKRFDEKHQLLFAVMKECAKELDLLVSWKPSGGVCDGNFLAEYGLPVIDTLGAIGGNMHTSEEFIYINSLTERASLTALLLMKLADREISVGEWL